MRTSIDARANLNLIEENYRRWHENPDLVDAGWSAFFEGFELGNLPQQNGTAAAEVEALEAESFEIFLHTRFVGQKRFSLQGSETLMVALETILHKCPEGGVEEISMGMAHRGRLNVLANFLRKSLKIIFTEFSENYIPDLVAGDGDVKYHLGYDAVRRLASGAEVEIRLSSNPSHLEAV